MTDKWAEYKKNHCGCHDASRKNSCKGLATCELPIGHPDRMQNPKPLECDVMTGRDSAFFMLGISVCSLAIILFL